MMRIAVIVIALGVLAIALMLGWDRYAGWRVTQDPLYRSKKAVSDSTESLARALDSRAQRQKARECWEDLEETSDDLLG